MALSPYETQILLDDLARRGPGTAVEITLPTAVPDAFRVQTERQFARLRPLGIEVLIQLSDDETQTPVVAATAPCTPRAVAELAVLMGRALHELQSERALTAAHCTAREGTATAHLQAQWRATDDVIAAWSASMSAHADLVPPVVCMHADAVRSLVTQLAATRGSVQGRANDLAETVDYYTQLTHALLATVDGLGATADAAPTMTAHLAFLHAKEEAAVEQLEVASATIRHGLSHSLAARVASRDAYLRTFATTAPEPVLSEYRALMGEPPCHETPGLGRALIEHECPRDTADAAAWYRTMAGLFERFRGVESRSAATLLQSAQ